MTDEIRDPFASSGPPAAKFEKIGDRVEGIITKIEYQVEKDPATGEVKRFSDGNPRPVVVVHLDVDGEPMRDFVKGRSVTQFRHEVHAVEGEGQAPKVGARYAREFTDTKKATKPGLNPERLFQVDYSNDNPGGNTDDDRDLV